MPRYEYKVVPAPAKGLKGKGVKGPEARFSNALQELMNSLAGYGWEYQRAETLPSTERSGLTGSTTEWRNVLVFRRVREEDADAFAPELLPPPVVPVPVVTATDAKNQHQAEGSATESVEKSAEEKANTPTSTAPERAEEIPSDAVQADEDPAKDTATVTPKITLEAAHNASKSDS